MVSSAITRSCSTAVFIFGSARIPLLTQGKAADQSEVGAAVKKRCWRKELIR
jgi:hypothetical protein